MLYVFADEKYLDKDGQKRFIIGLITVPQARWNIVDPGDRRVDTPGKTSRLARIEQLLEHTQGIGVLAYADFDPKLIPAGKLDSTTDIPRMARRDTAWSICLAQGIAAALKYFHKQGGHATTVDVYYDDRTIKAIHRGALAETVTVVTSQSIKHAARQGLASPTFTPRIRRCKSVSKAADGRPPDKLQVGTLGAHYLCQLAEKLIEHERRPRIDLCDITATAVDSLSKFKEPEGG